MENQTIVKVEMDIARQKLMNAFMAHNEVIAEQIKSGLEKAVSNFDFEQEVARQSEDLIKREIRVFMNEGGLQKIIRKKVEGIVEAIIDKDMNHLK